MMMTLRVLLCLFLQLPLFYSSPVPVAMSDPGPDPYGKHPMPSVFRASPSLKSQLSIATANKGEIDSNGKLYGTPRFYGGSRSGHNNYYPTNSLVKTPPIPPIPSKYGNSGIHGTRLHVRGFPNGHGQLDVNQKHGKWRSALLPKPDRSTFTPYIGTRALTNLPKFFAHLLENLDTIVETNGQESNQGMDLDWKAKVTESPASSKSEGAVGDECAKTELTEKTATPTRKSHQSKSEKLILNVPKQDLGGKEDPYEDRRSTTTTTSYPILASGVGSNDVTAKVHGTEPEDERTKELRRFLHSKSEYAKANNYNPSWLFTNLGFGKRGNTAFKSKIRSMIPNALRPNQPTLKY